MNKTDNFSAQPDSNLRPHVWTWPFFGYSLVTVLILVIFIPTAFLRWLTDDGAEVQADCGIMLPAFIGVVCYCCYCVVLLVKNRLTPLEIDRLQLAEHIAYSSGLLGAIFRLVALSHNTDGALAVNDLLGTLAPFKMGFSLWVGVVVIRWLAEHVAMLKKNP